MQKLEGKCLKVVKEHGYWALSNDLMLDFCHVARRHPIKISMKLTVL